MTEEKRGPGRPTIGERIPISLRVTPKMKRALDRAALRSGRSQSAEAEFHLERAFERKELLGDVLRLAYGEAIAADLMRLAKQMKAREDQPGHPFELAVSVVHAAMAISRIPKDAESSALHRQVGTTIEYWLKPFLVPDWRRAGEDRRDKNAEATALMIAEQAEEVARQKFKAEIIKVDFLERRSA